MIATKSDVRLAARVRQAALGLGLSFVQVRNIVEYRRDVPTAQWVSDSGNPFDGSDKIQVGDFIAELDSIVIEMVLRHEFLHRSTYHGFRERYPDPQLANIVEDICINRLLYEAYPEHIPDMCEAVYSDENRRSIIGLADCTTDPDLLPQDLQDLWNMIWQKDHQGRFSDLNPASLYFQLVTYRNNACEGVMLMELPWLRPPGDKGTSPSSPMGSTLYDAMTVTMRSMNKSIGLGSRLGNTFSDLTNVPIRLGTAKLKDFVRGIRTDHFRTDRKHTVPDVQSDRVGQPWPGWLSPGGVRKMVLGISDTTMMYDNVVQKEALYRLALTLYVDVSGSMSEFLSTIHLLLMEIASIPLQIKVFNETVSEVTEEKFKAGDFPIAGGTSFDAVFSDLLDDERVGAAIIATDGDATLSAEIKNRFRQSGKAVYVVYSGPGQLPQPLCQVANRWLPAGT